MSEDAEINETGEVGVGTLCLSRLSELEIREATVCTIKSDKMNQKDFFAHPEL